MSSKNNEAKPPQREISAVITSRNRKVQLEFVEDRSAIARLPEPATTVKVHNAFGKKIAGTNSSEKGQSIDISDLTLLGAQPPTDNKKSRSSRAVSHRQITVTVKDLPIAQEVSESSLHLNSTGDADISATSVVSMKLHHEHSQDQSQSVSTLRSKSLDQVVKTDRTESLPGKSVQFMLPSFIKSKPPVNSNGKGDAQSQLVAQNDATEGNKPNSATSYPSLSYRLRAKIGVDPTATPSATLFSKADSDKLRRVNKQHDSSSKALELPIPRASQARESAESSEIGSSQGFINLTENMELEDILQYLLTAKFDEKSGNAHFVHVTSRCNIESVNRENFYDLVVLERPGNPSTGYVWKRNHGHYAVGRKTLPPHQVMQLSLEGLLITSFDEGQPELIPIREFMKEKEQLEFLRTGRFFGLFKELKVFSAWKRFTNHHYVNRIKKTLLKDSFFSDVELVEALQIVAAETYSLETDTELFAFHGKGTINIADYFALQLQRIEEVRNALHNKLNLLGDAIAAKYELYLGSSKLQKIIQDVKDHHPLREVMQETEGHIDWVMLRSVQRLGDNFKDKIKRILYMAQYRIEYKLACILERFWLRMMQISVGIHEINDRRKDQQKLWDINYNWFDVTGKVNESAYDANINISIEDPYSHLHTRVREKESSALENGEGQTAKVEPKRVTSDWEKQGSHLSVYVKLFINNRLMELNDLAHLRSIEKLKIQIVPTKSAMLNQLHAICGRIGIMFESLPNLKQHKLIYEQTNQRPPDQELELGLIGDLQNAQSSNYFAYLVMFPTYNSRNGYNLAIETMRHFLSAFAEATSIDSHIFKLSEAFRKLYTLNPSALVKQVDRSQALNKIRDFIEKPDMIEDLRRSQARDKNRITALKAGVDFLEKLNETLSSILNLKNRMGLVTSFDPIIEQLRNYRAIQEYYIYERLPNSFVARCSNFYDFVRKLEVSYDNQSQVLEDQINLMRRFKNFESIKDFYDSEVEFCNGLYYMIEDHQNMSASEISSSDLMVYKFLSASTRVHAPALTPEKLFKVHFEAMERLSSVMGKSRSNLLAQLIEVRNNVMANKHMLIGQIHALFKGFEDFSIIDPEISSEEINNVISSNGKQVEVLRKAVEDSLSAQLILLEAHDIVGAANPVMTPNEIDRFENMDKLELFYSNRCSAWKIISDTDSILRQVQSSKLASNNIAELNTRFARLLNSFDELTLQLEDTSLVQHIQKLVNEVRPRVEMVSYLSSKALRPRHWQWLNKIAFKMCGLELKFSGRQSEFVSVYDVTQREPVGLGNVNRLSASELFKRYIYRWIIFSFRDN